MSLKPWPHGTRRKPVALVAVLVRLQAEPIEFAQQIVDAPAVVGEAADAVALRQLGDEQRDHRRIDALARAHPRWPASCHSR